MSFQINNQVGTIIYTETTMNQGGTAIVDLKQTRIYIRYDFKDDDTDTNAPLVLATLLDGSPAVFSASSPNGGGVVRADLLISVPEGREADVFVATTAVDEADNESELSTEITKLVDNNRPATNPWGDQSAPPAEA